MLNKACFGLNLAFLDTTRRVLFKNTIGCLLTFDLHGENRPTMFPFSPIQVRSFFFFTNHFHFFFLSQCITPKAAFYLNTLCSGTVTKNPLICTDACRRVRKCENLQPIAFQALHHLGICDSRDERPRRNHNSKRCN